MGCEQMRCARRCRLTLPASIANSPYSSDIRLPGTTSGADALMSRFKQARFLLVQGLNFWRIKQLRILLQSVTNGVFTQETKT